MTPRPYRGRFAPTPSGPLHLGSLLAALASWLDARRNGGRWLVRIDDLDGPRCPPGTDRVILGQLRAHGLHWDGEVHRQSSGATSYRDALEALRSTGAVYRCGCTRARLANESLPGPDGPVYSGRCRSRPSQASGRSCLRLRVPAGQLCFDDACRGRTCRDLPREVGDFVLVRSDGVVGYHLACAVDEAELGITHVVRGGDLLGSTFCQLTVLDALHKEAPAYLHLPVLTGPDGLKLSKQNHAEPLRDRDAAANLRRCLAWLGHLPPRQETDTPESLLAWGRANWDPERLPRSAEIPLAGGL